VLLKTDEILVVVDERFACPTYTRPPLVRKVFVSEAVRTCPAAKFDLTAIVGFLLLEG
jgi:hypothetical protein